MSKQRKLRSKLSFDADESEAADAPPPPPAPTGTKKDGSFKPKKSAMLSFGDEEEPLTSSSSGKAKKKDKGSAKPSKFNRGAAAAPVALSTAADAAAYRPTAGVHGVLCAVVLLWQLTQTAIITLNTTPLMTCSHMTQI
jgi:hypothetical protein